MAAQKGAREPPPCAADLLRNFKESIFSWEFFLEKGVVLLENRLGWFIFCDVPFKRCKTVSVAQWCNGSTTDSGSVSLGSNPGWAATCFLFY